MSRDRLIMGIATYGMSYTLKSQWQNGIKAPAYGAGAKGKYTNEKGILSYPEVTLIAILNAEMAQSKGQLMRGFANLLSFW